MCGPIVSRSMRLLHRLAADAAYALNIVDFSGTNASVAVCGSEISRRERPGESKNIAIFQRFLLDLNIV